jgi:hypothetical protein
VRYYEFMRFPSRLKLTIGQINGLRSFIERTNHKSEYRRAVAVFQKADGKTYDYMAREHRVQVRTTKKWINVYIKISHLNHTRLTMMVST